MGFLLFGLFILLFVLVFLGFFSWQSLKERHLRKTCMNSCQHVMSYCPLLKFVKISTVAEYLKEEMKRHRMEVLAHFLVIY